MRLLKCLYAINLFRLGCWLEYGAAFMDGKRCEELQQMRERHRRDLGFLKEAWRKHGCR